MAKEVYEERDRYHGPSAESTDNPLTYFFWTASLDKGTPHKWGYDLSLWLKILVYNNKVIGIFFNSM